MGICFAGMFIINSFNRKPPVTWNKNVSRPVDGTTFRPSTTNMVQCAYTVEITNTTSIGGPSSGSLLFQWSEDNGATWIDGPEVKTVQTATLAVVLQLVQTTRAPMTIIVPPNALCKLVWTSSGTASRAFVKGVETVF